MVPVFIFIAVMVIVAILLVSLAFLAWIVWEKKTNIFPDQMEPKLAERRLKRLKVFLLVAEISYAVFAVDLILQIALGLFQKEETASFYIAFVAIGVFIIATIGGWVIFIKGRRETT